MLVANAGAGRYGTTWERDPAEWWQTFEVNVLGVVHCTYAALDRLRATPGAHVVSMSSASAFYGVPEHAVYSASKFAVRGFTEALNLELERDGIHVRCGHGGAIGVRGVAPLAPYLSAFTAAWATTPSC